MNNQITVNNQGVQDIGELVTYFQIIQSGKNYIFYSKNESGPNNTIKLYVCEESNPQIMSNGIQNDWDNIKNIMAKIIKDDNISEIKFLPKQSNINVNSEKHIGLNSQNIDKLKSVYTANVGTVQNDVSPADILNQSFGGLDQTQNVQQSPIIQPVETPIELGVNDVPKNYDMEQTSANLNPIPSVQPLPEMPKIEPIIPETPKIDVDVTPLQPIIQPVDSPFNINNGSNVFDTPVPQNNFGINNDQINKPLNEDNKIIPEISNLDAKSELSNSSIDNDLINAEIAMNEKEINLYRSRIEFLESKNKFLMSKKNNKIDSNDLSNTAASLFDNNEVSDKVLTNVPDLNKVA